ncbi:YadA-like family protein [Halomonas mongoliensis]|uniref:YadA-like family protein n=1 Tax=Halomonas mongoliensis TaxID=321265 RepID=UPI00403A9B80
MNKVFRIIWNRTLGRLVVASEAAHSQGKSGAERLQAAPKADDRTASAGRLRPLVLAIGLAAAGAVIPAAIAQDATYDNVTVNNELIVSDTAILSALQVSGTAAFDGPLTVGGVNVATTTDISSLNDRVDSTEGDINANANAISANAGDISANQTEIANVKATASAGWNISAEGGAEDNVAPGGSVDFSGDGNIEVGRDGTELTFSLADEIEVESVTAGDVTLGASGLAISGGPSVTSDGIDAGGGRITNVAAGDLSADSSDAVIGSQIFDLFIGEEAGGVRYFRARSAQPDSEALGDESIAIGPRAKTTETAEGSIALGQGASVGTEDGAVDDGEGSIAIGRDSQASGTRTLALGDSAEVEDERVEDAMALGTGARVSGMESDRALAAGFEASASAADATALGASASASGGSSTALGAGSSASGGSSIALGDQASATAGGALAAGAGSVAATANSISLGTEAGVGTFGDPGGDRTDHIAIGRASGQNVDGNQNTAIGLQAGSGVDGDQNVAIGTWAGRGLVGNRNVALGHKANHDAGAVDRATAIGGLTSAAENAVAMGYKADAKDDGVALGSNTSAGRGAVALGRHADAAGGSVALGAGSAALSSDAQGAGYLTGSSFSDGTVVSVGNTDSGQSRRIVNVADGAQDLDAVNVGQLKGAQLSVATLVGGGVVLNPDGTYSPITVQNTDGDDVTFATVVEAIGAVTSGEVDILPVDAVRYNAEGGISNLSAGINATDAVNVEQLNEAVAESGAKYFSVNSTEPANRDNTLASGTDAMAIGPATSADGDSSLAVGHRAKTVGEQSVALGYSVEALGDESTAIGSRSEAYGDGGVAIGQRAVSEGENSIVIGTRAEADPKADGTVDNAIVIGTEAEATADNGIAIGESALASEERAVAQGFTAHALADDAQAYGSRAQATGVSSQASGTDARASGANAQASGTDARASGTNAIATGTDARGYASDGIALGTGARSGLANPLPEETDRNSNGIAIGNSALADNRNALALGVEAQAREESSTALGDSAEATAVDALAVGSSARSTAEGASALGEGAEATHERSVALGAGSTTSAPIGTSGATIDKVDYDYAGADPVATVSVGSEGEERTITNVAAGRVSATSTDAINGSQLHGTNMALESLADDLDTAGTFVADVLGGNASYDPETHQVTTSNVGGTGEDTVHDAIEYAAQGWDISANGADSENVAPGGSVDFSNTDGNIVIARDGTDLTFGLSDELEIASSITVGDTVIDGDRIATNNLNVGGGTFVVEGDNVTYGGNEVATQADGLSFAGNTGGTIDKTLGDDTPLTISGGLASSEASTDANLRVDSDGDQLNLVMARHLTNLDSVTTGDTVMDSDGVTVGDDVALDDSGLTIAGGPSVTDAGIDAGNQVVSNVADGVADSDAVNVGQLTDLAETPLTFAGDSGSNVERELGETLNLVGGETDASALVDGNIGVVADGTDTLSIQLAQDVDLGSDGSVTTGDTVMDSDGVNIGDGDVVLGDTGLVIGDADGPRFTGEGISAGDQVITNVARGVDGSDAVNVDQLGEVSDVANRGWNVSANGEDEPANVAPGGTVDFGSSDENIVITRDGTDLDFALADDLTGLESIGLNGIDGADGLTIRGGNGSPGTPGLDGENGITRIIYEDADGTPYEVATMDDGLVFAGNTGDDIARTLGETLTVSGELAADDDATGANLRVDSDGDQLNLVMARNLTELDSVTTGDTVMDSDGVNIGDGDVVLGDTGLVIGDADGPRFTDEGISAGDQVITNVARGVDGSDAVNVDQLGEVSDVANRGWNVSANGEDEPANVAPGGTVDFGSSDENIVITRDGTDLDFALADDLTGLESIGLNGIDGADGLTIRGGNGSPGTPGLDGENGITRIIYEDADGTPYEVATMDDGLVFAGNTGDDIARTLGETLTVSGELAADDDATGANLRVDSDGDQLNLVMARNLTELDSVTTGDTVMDSDGVNIGDGDVVLGNTGLVIGDADGPRFTGEGISAGDQVITNVARGVDGSDAVNVDQLGEVSDVANRGWNVSANGEDEPANVAPGGTVDFGSSDENIVITRDGTDLDFALADDLTGLESIGLNGIDGADGLTIRGGNGSPGTPGLDGEDGITRIIYEDADGTPYEVATMDDGLVFAGNTGDDIARTLGETLTVSGELAADDDATGANLRVDSDGDQLNLVMARNLTELDSVTTGDTVMDSDGVNIGDGDVVLGNTGLVIGDADGPRFTGEGISAGDQVITNVARGVDGSDAVNVDQLGEVSDVANRGWNISAQGGSETNVAPGGSVDLNNADGNLVLTKADDSNDVTFDLAESIDLGEDGSITTGDTVVNNDGVTVAGASSNDPSTTIGAGSIEVAGSGATPNTVVIDGESGTIGGLTNLDFDPDNIVSGQAATEDQLGQVSDVANAGWNVSVSGEGALEDGSNNVGPEGVVDFSNTDGNILIDRDGTDLTFGLSDELEIASSITVGDTVMDSDGVNIGDGDVVLGNTGLAVGDVDGDGASTEVGAGTITLAANPTTGPANEIVIDANSGTIGGLTNRDFDPDNFVSGQAATEDQLGQVYTVANAGWNVSVGGEGALEDGSNNVGPEGVVDFSNTDGNILIDRDGTDLAFNLNPELDLGEEGSVTIGGTIMNGEGVSVGDDVTLGDTGLIIGDADGPRFTNEGISAGDQVITGVADGDVTETSTDAINGSQLYAVQNIAQAGWNLSGSGENAVNIGPDGSVDFQGDSNITVSQTGVDQNGVIQVALNDSITLGEGENAVTVDGENGLLSVGDTIMSGEGVSVGDDVRLGSTGLVINDGPSVTTSGIDAGGMRITNLMAGVEATDAVNVSQLNEGVAAATTEVTAGSNISVSESTGDNGQTIYTVETQRDVNFDSIEVGSVNIDQNNVDENGNTIITGVGRGEVSENSTDAVNGSQLWDVQQELGDINQSLDGGMNFAADEGDAVNRRLGDTVAVTGDDNITTRTTGDGVQVTMNRDLDVDSVTTGRTTVSDQGVTIDGGPSMTVDGIDGGGMRITNVAPGVDATDAVNVGQMQELNQRFANEINNVHGRIDNVERNANAGTASALAAGTVPQAWMPGKSMVGVGAGTYEGESAVSVGVSRLSDNGRWVIQGKVTGDSQSNFGAGVGAGWHW